MEKKRIIEVVEIPEMDTSFMDDIISGGIADSGMEANGDVFFCYENIPNQETSEERLSRFGFDVEKIKNWQSYES
ncbi:hypothetical protein LS68_000720 [Helicobacter sp. MIT 05-5293]|uniref:hypothetical protein n=1 Tax=Helicobacter sp. MIT 05-5293 TaxID=1548149 RepID=UPI00051D5DC6|nr:hypothetical protein [Helicobacter sp. MIT 05-5293]TLD81590.1 hypothetical protein LS68_000720 [Helicobacter sp. MIT 05-5293]